MSSSAQKITDFPDVENKLQAPSKKSLFERQKAEAEAKRLREEAETKAVYEDFVKSFDDEEDEPALGGGGGRYGGFTAPPPMRRGGPGGFNNAPMGGRGFVGRGGSGPGSLGPPPQSLNKKRTFDGFQQPSGRSMLAFDDYEPEREREPKRVFHTSDDEEDHKVAMDRGEEKAVAKPTLRLASLPPGTSPAFIKTLIPSTITVDSVRIIPPSGPGTGLERKSMSAIVTLVKDTPANDIDSVVNTLQNRYLGFGYYLTLHRHLSSAAISSASISSLSTTQASHPFGAKAVSTAPQAGRGHAPPSIPGHNRNFAPPTSYGAPLPRSNAPLLHIPVTPPSSLPLLRLIHKTIESLLTHGPSFEALLMTRPSVQRSENWAWLWDPRSQGGVYYRWRLWSILTSTSFNRSQRGKYLPLFSDSHAWKAPERDLPYEYTTSLEEFISDSDYNSSDEDDSDNEGGARKPTGGPLPMDPLAADEGKAYLTPLSKAKLTHLLARLPTSTSRLRKGDVARVTAFAISHAGKGADEVVSLLVQNVERPFAYTSANPSKPTEEERDDPSSAQLIALYLISDILSSSSTSGVRHAWRYRSLFENALKAAKTFEKLGGLEKKLKWGRLRGEKWKRSVGNLLALWEGWCVFPSDAHEKFVKGFEEGGSTVDAAEEDAKKAAEKSKGKWKAVEVEAAAPAENEDVDGEPMVEDDEDVDGEPMVEDDEDVDGEPMVEDDEDVDGVPMEEDQEVQVVQSSPPPPAAVPVEEKKASPSIQSQPKAAGSNVGALAGGGTAGPGKVKRLRAVDMFADSDSD